MPHGKGFATGLALVLSLGVSGSLTNPAVRFVTRDPPALIPDNTGGTFVACQTVVVTGAPIFFPNNNVVEVAASHSWVGDLTMRLTSPAGTTLTLLNRPGRTGSGAGNSDDLVGTTPIFYTDFPASGLSAEDIGDSCGGTINGSTGCPDNYSPGPDASDTPIAGQGTALSSFDGENPNGTWTLCAADSAGGDTGTLISWSLNFCIPVELESFTVE